MFSNIKLSRHSSPALAGEQPSVSRGPDSSKGKTSTNVHPALAGRGSPVPGEGSLAPRRPVPGRSQPLSSEAQASAHAAFPRQHVHFAEHATAIPAEDGQKIRQETVEFGPKPRPEKINRSSHEPSPSAPSVAPAPEPKAAEPHESTRRLFGGLFRSHGHRADKPAARPPSKQAETSAPDAGQRRPERSPGQKFSERFTTFMEHCPDKQLRDKLSSPIMNGQFEQFKKEAIKASTTIRDRDSFQLVQLMIKSIDAMQGDFSDVRIKFGKPRA